MATRFVGQGLEPMKRLVVAIVLLVETLAMAQSLPATTPPTNPPPPPGDTVVGPRFASFVDLGIGGGIFLDEHSRLAALAAPSFCLGAGVFVTPALALSARFAGSTYLGFGVSFLGFTGPSLQAWAGDRAFIAGGAGIGFFGRATGLGLDFRAGLAFHKPGHSDAALPRGQGRANISTELTTASVRGFTIKTVSILIGYQAF